MVPGAAGLVADKGDECVAQVTIQQGHNHHTRLLKLQLGIAFAAFLFIGAQDGAGGVLLPSLQRQYSLNKSTVSYMFFASTLGYLIAAFSSGPLVERLGRRKFLTLGAVMLCGGLAVVALVPIWLVVLLAVMSLGFGIALIDAGLNAYVAGLPDNTALLNYLHAFYGGGALIGPLLASGLLTIGLGWNMVYVVLAVGFLLLALSLASVFAEHDASVRAQKSSNLSTHSVPTANLMGATLSLPVVWLAALFLLLYVGVEVSIGSWTFSFLTEQRSLSTLLAGWLVSSYWTGLTLGRLVLGSVTRRLGNLLMVQLCLGGLVLGLLLLWLLPNIAAAGLGLVLSGFSLGPIFPTVIAIISQVLPQRLIPTAIGFMTSLGAAGAALFPWVAGNVANRFGVWIVPPYAIVLTIGILVLWLLFQRYAGAAEQQAVQA